MNLSPSPTSGWQRRAMLILTLMLVFGLFMVSFWNQIEDRSEIGVRGMGNLSVLDESNDGNSRRQLRKEGFQWDGRHHYGYSAQQKQQAYGQYKENQDDDEQQQKEEHSIFPLTLLKTTALLLAFTGLILAAGGGIGGGGILVPIYILLLQFDPKHAIPLSNITVFGGAVANTLLYSQRRHPLADRPLIDWDLVLIMEPLTLAGALAGSDLGVWLPEEIVVVALVGVLGFTAHKTLGKARKMYEKETEEESKRVFANSLVEELVDDEMEMVKRRESSYASPHKGSPPGDDVPVRSDMLDKSAGPSPQTPLNQGTDTSQVDNPQGGTPDPVLDLFQNSPHKPGNFSGQNESYSLQKIIDEERQVPTWNVLTIVSLFLIVLLINILKGGGGFPSPVGIKCNSFLYWMTRVFILFIVLIVSGSARSYLLQKSQIKQSVGYKFLEGDIRWTDGNVTTIYPLFCAMAGFVAGLFGIGGGIVKGPLMLALGVNPQVAAATSACMILFTTFTATTSFAVFGLLVKEYAALCLFMGFGATLLGQTIMGKLIRNGEGGVRRNSYIAFCIGGVVLLSAICMTIESVLSIRREGFFSSTSSSGPCTNFSD